MLNLKSFFFRRERFTQGAAVLTITTFLSYVTGLLRDRIFARTFGAGRELDLYNASFIIPDLLLNILVASALSAAFIPIFTGLVTQGEQERANALANSVLHAALFAIFIAGSLAALFMSQLSKFIAPGFTESERETLVSLSRLMLISPLLMTLSNFLGAMLVSFKRFLAYGLSPILYNIGIIAGAFTASWFGIYGLVLGTLFGAALHLMPRLTVIYSSRPSLSNDASASCRLHRRLPSLLPSRGWATSLYHYAREFKFRDPHFKKVIKLMIPKMIGHPVEQFTFLGFTRIATMFAAGSVTAVSFARNFQSVPVSLFGIAFSVAIFPTLAECAAKGDRENFLKNFWKVLRDILIFTIPSALGLYLLSDLPIRIFLGGGKFSDENILRTASVLSIFALSVPTESLAHLLARSFYALKNTIIPVVLSVFGLFVSISFAIYQSKSIGILAIPYGFFLGSFMEVILLAFLLRRKIKMLWD